VIRLPVLWLGKLLMAAARLRGGGGSALPGLVVERVWASLLATQLRQLPLGYVIVTGTNGKTTTTKMLTTVLAADHEVVTNRSGSNMVRGLLSAVIEQSTWGGRLPGDLAVFEVDEPNVPKVAALLPPRVLVILNLHRDQLDRFGELEHTATLLGQAAPIAERVVLNADDPLVARLAGTVPPEHVAWFGVSPALRAALPDDANLLVGAPSAPPAVAFDALGAGVVETDEADGRQRVTLRIDGADAPADLPLPGVYNATNLAAVATAVRELGIDPVPVLPALADMTPAFGRGERIQVDDRVVVLQLVKNPSSFTQIIRTQLVPGPPRSLLIAINDNLADGRDVSWLWDVDFEALHDHGDRVLVTGLRGTDLAMRLKYADIDCEVVADPDQALTRHLAGLGDGEVGMVIPTYTAMLDLRARLGRRTDLEDFWE
jgi:UDP-N-acetylmuramyl tripeptide synthase